MSVEQWNDPQARSFAMLIDGRAQPTGIRRKGLDRTLLLMINAHHEAVHFVLPTVPGGDSWRLLVDTDRNLEQPRRRSQSGSETHAAARSLLLWELRPPQPDESNGS
jgi:glycogen operon protein